MSTIIARIEVDRVISLVRIFGWMLTKQEILEDKIILTIEKTRPVSIFDDEGVKS